MTGSTTSTRQGWALLGAVVVAAFAGVLHLSGAEGAEVVATLLFGVVFAAALLGGRVAGLVAAAGATALYAWLRRDAADDAGSMRLGVVVLGRAASYVVLAYVTDLTADRLPPLPFGGSSVVKRAAQDGGEQPLQPLELDVGAEPGAMWTPEAAPGWDPEPVQVDTGWEPAGPEPAPTGSNGYHEAPYDPYQPVGANGSALDEAGPAEDWSPSADRFQGEWEDQTAFTPAGGGHQAVPAGWLQDDDFGDEIPVGYTGELFLQDLAGGGEEQVPGQVNGENVPMIDGMPFGQPIEPIERIDTGGLQRVEDYGGYDDAGTDAGLSQAEPAPYGQTYDQGWTTDHAATQQNGWESPQAPQPYYGGHAASPQPAAQGVDHIDPETRLWTASYFRDRLAAEYDAANATGAGFSVVMIQIPDTPFRTLSRRREVALLRELGHQFIRAQVVDHLVHLPDGNHHWFAAVLSDIDRGGAHAFERRLRSAIAGYLRNRGLSLEDIQSATLTSPDDDQTMSEIWATLLGESEQDQVHSNQW
jgi:hypothetical protein